MKKILKFAALFAGLSFAASAQQQDSVKKDRAEVRQEMRHKKHMRGDRMGRMDNKTPEDIAKMKTDRLDKELKFTEDQKKDIYAYHLDQAKKWKAKSEERKADREARKNEMKAEREEFLKLLTPEQKETLKNKMAENRKDGFKRGDRKDRQFKRRDMDRKPVEKKAEETVNVESSNS
jgi:Spy/CpxP family protein refolding chaperone